MLCPGLPSLWTTRAKDPEARKDQVPELQLAGERMGRVRERNRRTGTGVSFQQPDAVTGRSKQWRGGAGECLWLCHVALLLHPRQPTIDSAAGYDRRPAVQDPAL